MEKAKSDISWRDWFKEFGSRWLLYARQFTHNENDAQDILQEAFVRVWRSYGGNQPFNPGLVYRAIRHAALDRSRGETRRRRREEVAASEFQEDNIWFIEELEGKERQKLLSRALKMLTNEQQEVIQLKIWGEMTFEQIASILGIPANTAASRYRYALNHLKSRLTSCKI